jgi:hypothetical protein
MSDCFRESELEAYKSAILRLLETVESTEKGKQGEVIRRMIVDNKII